MSTCSFDKLLSLLDRQLDLDEQLQVFDHLDRCDICQEAVYLIARDRDWSIYAQELHSVEPLLKAS